MKQGWNFSKKKCPVCKKRFEIIWCDQWAYKHLHTYYCSWTCLRKAEQKRREKKRPLAVEDEPEHRTAKNYRPKQYSQDVIKKVLTAIEEGDDPVMVLQQMGYDHWKKWYDLKKWAEKHDPDLRSRMPETLSTRKNRAG